MYTSHSSTVTEWEFVQELLMGLTTVHCSVAYVEPMWKAKVACFGFITEFLATSASALDMSPWHVHLTCVGLLYAAPRNVNTYGFLEFRYEVGYSRTWCQSELETLDSVARSLCGPAKEKLFTKPCKIREWQLWLVRKISTQFFYFCFSRRLTSRISWRRKEV